MAIYICTVYLINFKNVIILFCINVDPMQNYESLNININAFEIHKTYQILTVQLNLNQKMQLYIQMKISLRNHIHSIVEII